VAHAASAIWRPAPLDCRRGQVTRIRALGTCAPRAYDRGHPEVASPRAGGLVIDATKEAALRTPILIFLIAVAVVFVTGASASDGPSGAAGVVTPPAMSSDVTCTSDPAAIQQELEQAGIPATPGQYAKVCFFPEHMR
jgi:hypothetical protein